MGAGSKRDAAVFSVTARRLKAAAFLAVLGALAAMTSPGRAQTPEELREQRKQVQEQAALAASDIDAHTTDAAELVTAIEALEAGIDAQQAALDAARRAVAEAEAVGLRAEQDIAELEHRQQATLRDLREAAVEAYVEFQGVSDLQRFIADPWGSTRLETLAEFGTGSGGDELDRLRTIEAELAEHRRIADEAAVEAREKQAEVDAQLGELESALVIRQALLIGAEDRLEARLAEAVALEQLDAELSDQIKQEEDRIARALEAERIAQALEAERKARELAEKREAEARAQALEAERKARELAEKRKAEANKTPGEGEPGESGDTPGEGEGTSTGTAATPKTADKVVTEPGVFTEIELTMVRGIQVNALIAEDLEALLAAMEAEGYLLKGGGWRSNARQIELRRQHCGTSDHAIWKQPASRCRPPTARPGRSNHEVGLAVDFTHNGRILRSRSTDVYKALARIAPEHGFRNLPSEPWHWDHELAR